jgi:hypothetical protein
MWLVELLANAKTVDRTVDDDRTLRENRELLGI